MKRKLTICWENVVVVRTLDGWCIGSDYVGFVVLFNKMGGYRV